MSQPSAYVRQANFTDWSEDHPTTPHEGVALDAEFNALVVSITGILSNLLLIQRVARHRLERADLLARIPPMLGLMATIIPLGPGLAALGKGHDEYADVVAYGKALAARLTAVKQPTAKQAEAPDTPAENPPASKPAAEKPAAAKGAPASRGLIQSVRNIGETKGFDDADLLEAFTKTTGLAVEKLEDLDKAQAASLLAAVTTATLWLVRSELWVAGSARAFAQARQQTVDVFQVGGDGGLVLAMVGAHRQVLGQVGLQRPEHVLVVALGHQADHGRAGVQEPPRERIAGRLPADPPRRPERH